MTRLFMSMGRRWMLMRPEINDGMTATQVWSILDDLMSTIELADTTEGKQVYRTAMDYIANTYGE